jgi:hypothetical protein
MKFPILRILWGLLLIVAGVLFLLDLVEYISIGYYQWAIILGIGGLAFLSVFIADRNQWWALFPSFGLLIGAAVLFSDIGGVIAMGGIGLAFLIIYLINTDNWWALIPAGALISLSLAVGLSYFITGLEVGGVFLMGLGLTFGLLGLVPTQQGRMRWAFIPAVILLAIGFVILLASFNLFLYLWPLGLIAVGVLIIYGVIRTRK